MQYEAKLPHRLFVVDPDQTQRQTLEGLGDGMRMDVQWFSTAEEFLQSFDGQASVGIFEVTLSGMSGLELQRHLLAQEVLMPHIVRTSLLNPSIIVKAMKNGATTVLKKPSAEDDLWLALRDTINKFEYLYPRHALRLRVTKGLELLTKGERDVLNLVVKGWTNKSIAAELDVSPRTVDSRKKKLCTKLEVSSNAELVRYVLIADEKHSSVEPSFRQERSAWSLANGEEW